MFYNKKQFYTLWRDNDGPVKSRRKTDSVHPGKTGIHLFDRYRAGPVFPQGGRENFLPGCQ
jgi:hypothetical protein